MPKLTKAQTALKTQRFRATMLAKRKERAQRATTGRQQQSQTFPLSVIPARVVRTGKLDARSARNPAAQPSVEQVKLVLALEVVRFLRDLVR